MFSATNLFCERDERVLFTQLNFTISAGEVIQVQGANGSGKTSLLRILAGLNADFTGDISWQGQAVNRRRETFNAGLFYLGHSPAINKTLTPLQNLRWYCACHGFSDDTAIVLALADLGLAGYEHIPCHQMSAGQQRRVSLARLQLSVAPLWILDEPFTALDKQGVADLEQCIDTKVRQGGAVILTTHHALQLQCPVRVINLDELQGVGA